MKDDSYNEVLSDVERDLSILNDLTEEALSKMVQGTNGLSRHSAVDLTSQEAEIWTSMLKFRKEVSASRIHYLALKRQIRTAIEDIKRFL